MSWRKILLVGWLVTILVVAVTPALAQTPQPPKVTDDAVNSVAKELYCPVCENIPLDVCPTQACASGAT